MLTKTVVALLVSSVLYVQCLPHHEQHSDSDKNQADNQAEMQQQEQQTSELDVDTSRRGARSPFGPTPQNDVTESTAIKVANVLYNRKNLQHDQIQQRSLDSEEQQRVNWVWLNEGSQPSYSTARPSTVHIGYWGQPQNPPQENLGTFQPAPSPALSNVKYHFGYQIDDNIEGGYIKREEQRDNNGRVTGYYTYDDGHVLRKVSYEADENGFRVLRDDVVPGRARALPHGTATVNVFNNDASYQYTVTKDQISQHGPNGWPYERSQH